jgi:Plasmid pRiA4b ORF-3-like protein
MAVRAIHAFRVSLQSDPTVYRALGSSIGNQIVYREIEIRSTASLERLAAVIVTAFNFEFDHAFGFYSELTGRNALRSDPRYELFRDIGESTDSQSVKHTTVGEAFSKPKHKMLFLFDYGDEWRFVVELLRIGTPEKGMRYPRLTKVDGTAPKQYPDPEQTIH